MSDMTKDDLCLIYMTVPFQSQVIEPSQYSADIRSSGKYRGLSFPTIDL